MGKELQFMRRTKLNKKGKTKVSILKRKLWEVFSKYIRQRDKGICFTCGRKCEGSGYHAGHFIPKSVGGIALYFNEENVHGQCYNCNINLGGNQFIFGTKLGLDIVNKLYAIKQQTNKWTEEDYLQRTAYYKEKINE